MSASPFDSPFDAIRQRTLKIGGFTGAGWGFAIALGLLIAAAGMDLVWQLTAGLRVAAVSLAAASLVALLVSFVIDAWRRSGATSVARRLDETGRTGGTILSGFELQPEPGGSEAASLRQALAQLAVASAARSAVQIPSIAAVPATSARRAAAVAAGAVAVILAGGLFAPRLVGTEFLRFIDPYGDHPPYSATLLRVEPGDVDVRYGDSLVISVATEGPAVDELELVLSPAAGGHSGVRQEEVLPLFAEAAGSWKTTVASVVEPGSYWVRGGGAHSHRCRVGVITVPEIEEVRFRVRPPAYTRQPEYEGPLPQGGISALKGTEIEFHARSNRPLGAGRVELDGGGESETVRLVPATHDGDRDSLRHEVSGRWTVSRAAVFQLTVTDVAGQDSREPFTGTISLLEDKSPFVRLIEPAPQSLATPSIDLPLAVAAEDDFGVTSLRVFQSTNDSPEEPLDIAIESPPPRRVEQTVRVPLSTRGLQPGDVIKIFARVEDNDPAGAKGSESPVAVVTIVSDEDMDRLVREREGLEMLLSKYQQAERRLAALESEMEQLQKQLDQRDPEGKLSAEEQDELERLSQRMKAEAEAVRESAQQLLSYDIDESLNDELRELAEEIASAAQAVEEAAARPESTVAEARQALADAARKLNREKQEFHEGVNDPLERLEAIYQLMEDQARFEELTEKQRDLADRLASLKGEHDPADPATRARMRELETEQRNQRDELEALLGDIESHAERLPEDDPKLRELAESARSFAQEVRACDAGEEMAEAEMGLAEFDGERGHSQATRAADSLEQFLSKCQGNSALCQGACEGLKFKPGQGALGDTLNQLLADAGFKPGRGKRGNDGPLGSLGAGGGRSARRSALSRLGLYGKLPTKGNPTPTQGRGGKDAPTIGGSYRAEPGDGSPSNRLDPHGLLKASGVGENAVPVRYRTRIEQYFRRIADENP